VLPGVVVSLIVASLAHAQHRSSPRIWVVVRSTCGGLFASPHERPAPHLVAYVVSRLEASLRARPDVAMGANGSVGVLAAYAALPGFAIETCVVQASSDDVEARGLVWLGVDPLDGVSRWSVHEGRAQIRIAHLGPFPDASQLALDAAIQDAWDDVAAILDHAS
jgi:hypothetical protein